MEGTYYELYNPYILVLSFIILSTLLIWMFRQYSVIYFGYLNYHFIWNTSILALLVAYIYKYGFSLYGVIFLLSHVLYLLFLFMFFKYYQGKINECVKKIYIEKINLNKIKYAYVVIVFILLYSKSNFFTFIAANPSIIDWILYKFEELQGRNPVFRILNYGGLPFFLYFSFLLIKLNIWKNIAIFFLFIYYAIALLSGERSALIGLLLSYALFLEFYHFLYTKKYINLFNNIAVLAIPIIIGSLSVVTMLYNSDSRSIADGLMIVLNRIFANGDGAEIYLLENAQNHLDSGLWAFIESAFGIFLKNLFGSEVKSIGWQLYDIRRGNDTLFATGANYILPLQVAVIGWWYIFLYVPFMAWIVSKIYIGSTNHTKYFCLDYALKSAIFILPSDVEYAVLVLVSIFIVYFLFLYPILTVKWN